MWRERDTSLEIETQYNCKVNNDGIVLSMAFESEISNDTLHIRVLSLYFLSFDKKI